MARDTWHAQFCDGQTADLAPVQVRVGADGLEVIFADRPLERWAYGSFRQTEGFYTGEWVRLEKNDVFGQALAIEDVGILRAIRARYPASGFHDPAVRKYRPPLVGLCIACIVLVIWLTYGYGLPVLVDGMARIAPVAWENALGRSVVAYIAPEADRCGDAVYAEVVDEVVARLTARADLPYTFRVYVVDDDHLNAYALPGGYISITTRFLKQIKSPEQLAGIIAHEIQHVAQRHGTRAVFRAIATRALVAAISSEAGGLDYVLDNAAMVGAMRFSRRHESAADIQGMKMILDAEIAPAGMVEVFEIILAVTGDVPDGLAYISSHPLTKDRIRSLAPYTDSLKVAPRPIVSDSTWARFEGAIREGKCLRQ